MRHNLGYTRHSGDMINIFLRKVRDAMISYKIVCGMVIKNQPEGTLAYFLLIITLHYYKGPLASSMLALSPSYSLKLN